MRSTYVLSVILLEYKPYSCMDFEAGHRFIPAWIFKFSISKVKFSVLFISEAPAKPDWKVIEQN